MTEFALYYEPSSFSFSEKTMGRQAAGASLIQAIANAKLDRTWCFAHSRSVAQDYAHTLAKLGSPRTGIGWIPFDRPESLAQPGVLFRPDPVLNSHAWHRQDRSSPRDYSLCGITHTISTHGVTTALASLLTSPLASWDALICTSRVARDAVRFVLEQQSEFLREHLGATQFHLPQLPVIPLGVHTKNFNFTQNDRNASRRALNIADDEVVVLFAGRLIVHGKAHPLPMYLALERASSGKKVVLIQAGISPNKQIEDIYTHDPEIFCPSVRTIMVDGRDEKLYKAAWASADIFTSLSDNIQETFGLTPLEAMAAGIPVVVSDWDGYKDTVRHNVDGFRASTLSLPAGHGGLLADRYDIGFINFDYYSGFASQLVAVDIDGTAEFFRKLIVSPELRRTMGSEGARRAREIFDWSVIFRRYLALWEELAERRRADPQLTPPSSRRRRPDRPDPFAMFSTYPTHHTGAGISFRRHPGVEEAEAISRRELAAVRFAQPILPDADLISTILKVVGIEWITYDTIILSLPPTQPDVIASALTWLSKVGVLDFKKA